jgi:hypothetical protein
LAILAKNRTEPENAVARFPHVQRRLPLNIADMAGPDAQRCAKRRRPLNISEVEPPPPTSPSVLLIFGQDGRQASASLARNAIFPSKLRHIHLTPYLGILAERSMLVASFRRRA